jgi:hypothetical protein
MVWLQDSLSLASHGHLVELPFAINDENSFPVALLNHIPNFRAPNRYLDAVFPIHTYPNRTECALSHISSHAH